MAKNGEIEKNKFELSIIIVSYNSRSYLDECLKSIFKYHPFEKNDSALIKGYDKGGASNISTEVFVVDNGSNDGSAELVRDNYSDVKLIANSQNLGFSKANNIAIKKSNARYVMLLNSDCEVYQGSIEKLVNFMQNHPEAGVAGPKIINSDGSIQLSCRRFPSFFDAGMHSLLEHIIPGNRFSRRYKLADVNREKPFEVDWVSGSAMILRRRALNDSGLLDENYFMYVEDIDLCYQMWKKGWKVYYNPYSSMLHHVGKSTHHGATAASVRMQKSIFYFFWKNYRKTYRIIFLPFLLLFLGLRILLTFLKNLLK
ncbi:MAG: glycosyltransferase family 2 protein [Actinobacteria bacterium]|nr:glycosyltransferase family 2 protein [Actinomycetota bacterium]